MSSTLYHPQREAACSVTLSLSRLANSFREIFCFGLIGGSGVVVNLVVFYIAQVLLRYVGFHAEHPVVGLVGTDYSMRYYHVMAFIAFIVANIWNYHLNRMWTFKGKAHMSWLKGLVPFLITGAGALLVSMIFLTLFMHSESPIALSDTILDNSTGLRTKAYWAQGLSTVIAMPINFLVNKIWTFRS